MIDSEQWENRRRSIAMLAPGAPSGLSREEALELFAEWRWTRERLEVAARAAFADEAERLMRPPSRSEPPG